MTPEAMNVKLAEFDGKNPYRWTFNFQHEEGFDSVIYESEDQAKREWITIYSGPKYAGPIERIIQTPDYCNDLNAIHEVEAKLTEEQWEEYEVELGNVLFEATSRRLRHRDYIHATAAQKAEALCRALGLGKEGA